MMQNRLFDSSYALGCRNGGLTSINTAHKHAIRLYYDIPITVLAIF